MSENLNPHCSLAIVQSAPELFAVEQNLNNIIRTIEHTQADILVFPELATSGYYYLHRNEVETVALEFVSDEMQQIQALATTRNTIIVVGFAEKADHDKLYNSAAIFMPDATQSRVYRKSHLFYKEKYCFDAGDSGFFVIEDRARDIRIGTMICYDWRFPESARSLALMGADLIVCPSNLVTHIWTKVMPTRAIENKVYLAVANRWGSETRTGETTAKEPETVAFNGQSHIYSYNGEALAAAPAEGDAVLFASIEAHKTRDKSFNSENDIFRDRRPELYTL